MTESLTLCLELNNKYPIAMAMAFLAGPAVSQGYPHRAALLLGAANALNKAMTLDLQPTEKFEIDRFEAEIREQLSKEEFESAWENGQVMTFEQAFSFALS
jgi:hypothetical protein